MNKNIIIIILALVFIAAVVFLDVPKVQEILYLQKEIKAQNDLLAAKQDLVQKIEELTGKYKTNEETWKKVDYILPSQEDVPNLIVQIESMAVGGGLALKKIDFTTADIATGKSAKTTGTISNKAYKTLTISLRVNGSYASFKGFLKAVEENMRLMDIHIVNFSPVSTSTQETSFNFDVTLTTYYYP